MKRIHSNRLAALGCIEFGIAAIMLALYLITTFKQSLLFFAQIAAAAVKRGAPRRG